MKKLDGKIAVITGATSGMGFASAKLFVQEGAYVFITGRRQEQLDNAVSEIGKNVTGIQGDVGNLDDLDRLYEEVRATKGHIDIVFASAGVGELDKPLGFVTEEGFHNTFIVNARGTLFTVQKALPLLKDGSSIILNASIVGLKGFPGAGVYSVSKAAVRSFARTWAAELKTRKIRVNAISPGPIDTAMFGLVPPENRAAIVNMVPVGRIGEPHEIATAALFLASDDSSFVTGIELCVDGGIAQV